MIPHTVLNDPRVYQPIIIIRTGELLTIASFQTVYRDIQIRPSGTKAINIS